MADLAVLQDRLEDIQRLKETLGSVEDSLNQIANFSPTDVPGPLRVSFEPTQSKAATLLRDLDNRVKRLLENSSVSDMALDHDVRTHQLRAARRFGYAFFTSVSVWGPVSLLMMIEKLKGYSVMVEDVAVYALIASTLGMAVWAIHTFARGVDPKTLEGLAESYFAKSLKSLCLDLGEAGVDADLTQKFRNDIMRACNVDLDSAARGAEDIKRYAYNSYARNPVRRV